MPITQVSGPNVDIPRGPRGLKGDAPAHEFVDSGTKIRFQNPDGTWGETVEISTAAAQLAAAQAQTSETNAQTYMTNAQAASATAVGAAGGQFFFPLGHSQYEGNSVEEADIPANVLALQIAGLDTLDDGQGGTYVRVSAEPALNSAIRRLRSFDRRLPSGLTDSVNGGWWQETPSVPGLDIEMFGAVRGDVDTYADRNADALQAATDAALATGLEVLIRPFVYQLGTRSSGTNPTMIYASIGSGQSIVYRFLGSGAELKEKDGKTNAIGRFTKMFFFALEEYVDAGSIVFTGPGVINKNAESSFSISKPARVATTSNIVLSGIQTIDGVLLSAGDIVFARVQTSTAQNGRYTVAAGAWAREAASDTGAEVLGELVVVTEGVTYGGVNFRNQNSSSITLGTTGLAYGQDGLDVSYTYEQAHSVLVALAANSRLKRLMLLDGMHFLDKAGGHVVVGSGGTDGVIEHFYCDESVHFDGYTGEDYIIGRRGDIEAQGVCQLFDVRGVGDYVQFEPNAGGFSEEYPMVATFAGRWQTLDLVGFTGSEKFCRFTILPGTKVTDSFSAGGCVVTAVGADLQWAQANAVSNIRGTFTGCTIRVKTDGAQVTHSIYPRWSGAGSWDVVFDHCYFTVDDDSIGAGYLTGYAIQGAQVMSLADAAIRARTVLNSPRFDPRFKNLIDSHRVNGTILIDGGRLDCWGDAIRVGGLSGNGSFIETRDVDFSGVGGNDIMINASGNNTDWGLKVSGRYFVGGVVFGFSDGNVAAVDNNTTRVMLPRLLGDAAPTTGNGAFFRGMRMEIRSPSAGGFAEKICVTSHASTGGTWRDANAIT